MMARVFQDSLEFKNIDFSKDKLPMGDYEDCVFSGCMFTSCILNGSNFGDCEFVDCDLSMANLTGITVRDIRFKRCKILGVKFESCNKLLFSVRAVFLQSNLEKSDFRTAVNYSIDPELNRIKKARFSLEGVSGLLGKHDLELD